MSALTALDYSHTLPLDSFALKTEANTKKPNGLKRFYPDKEKVSPAMCKYSKLEKIPHPAESINTITNQMLMLCFKRGAMLGRYLSDYTSMVVAVEDQTSADGPPKVLKITNSFPPVTILPILQAIWSSGESIHLTETVLLGKIEVRAGPFLQIDNNHGGFVHLPRANKKKQWAFVYIMDQKKGDLKVLKREGLSDCEEAAIEVQRVATEAFLNTRGIEPVDLKDINILYRLLTPEDRFHGRHISMYDYLKYTIASQSYFLPVSKYIITLCDYDKWGVSQVKKDFSHVLDERLKYAPDLLREIEKFKIVPPDHSRILSMS